MGSPLCSGAIPALPGQSLSQVAGAEAHRVRTDLTPFPLSACSPCPSMGMLPPEWGRGVMMKQGGPLLVSAADRGLSCLLHTACQVPAIVTLSHGTQSQVQVSLFSQSWSLPTPPTSLCVFCPAVGQLGPRGLLARWMVWVDCRQGSGLP